MSKKWKKINMKTPADLRREADELEQKGLKDAYEAFLKIDKEYSRIEKERSKAQDLVIKLYEEANIRCPYLDDDGRWTY